MTKEELKALGLTDEQVTKISEDYGKNYVAKSQFNEKNEALKNAEKVDFAPRIEEDRCEHDGRHGSRGADRYVARIVAVACHVRCDRCDQPSEIQQPVSEVAAGYRSCMLVGPEQPFEVLSERQ